MAQLYTTQNNLLLTKLMKFYNVDNNLEKILTIINGENKMSLRLIDWFVTNWAKKYYTVYNISENGESRRFKVYTDYKLKLKAYSKKRFDPFCRWDRIIIPYDEDNNIQTTIGQLNFFKWVLENKLLDFKESGKFIYAYADSYSQTAYYLASVSDKISLNPEGIIELKGLSAGVIFYKGLMDKLGIEEI